MSQAMPLAGLVYARFGTKAAQVKEEMRRVNNQRRKTDRYVPLEFLEFAGERPEIGVVLEPLRYSRSYSLRYQLGHRGAFVLFIGEGLPDNRIHNAATDILAMIKRGRKWETEGRQGVMSFTEAYGMPKQPNNRRRREHQAEENRRRRRRSLAAYA